MGYDASKAQYVDMFKEGIIDPAKVVRISLVNASGVASLMLTTDVMIVDLPKEKGEKEEDKISPTGMDRYSNNY